MPLSAIIGGTATSVIALGDAGWQHLRDDRPAKGEIVCPSCAWPMHTQLWRGSLRIFAHYPHGDRSRCDFAGESARHLALKDELARAATAAGATVDIEHAFVGVPSGRVDVLATMPAGDTWALEAQISPLGVDDAVDRDRKYRAEFGHTTWVHTGPRPWRRQIPALEVGADDDTELTVVGGVFTDFYGDTPAADMPVATAVRHVLTGTYVYVFVDRSEEAGGFGYYVDRTVNVDAAKRTLRRKAKTAAAEDAPPEPTDVCRRTGADLSGGPPGADTSGPCRWCGQPASCRDRHGWVHPACEQRGRLFPLGPAAPGSHSRPHDTRVSSAPTGVYRVEGGRVYAPRSPVCPRWQMLSVPAGHDLCPMCEMHPYPQAEGVS